MGKMLGCIGGGSQETHSKVEEVISEALKLSKRSRISRNLCKWLQLVLAVVGDFLELFELFKLELQHNLAIQGVLESMDAGLDLIRSCTGKGSIVQALLREENMHEFHQVYLELYESVWLVTVSAMGSLDDTVHASYKKVRKELDDIYTGLKQAAQTDREELLKRTQDVLYTFGVGRGKKREGLRVLKDLIGGDKGKELPWINHEQVTLTAALGVGSFAAVYEARWLGEVFAVKVYGHGLDTRRMRWLLMKHPRIVRVVGCSFSTRWERDDQVALVMEKANTDLETLIRTEPRKVFSMEKRVSILLQIAEGMRFLHSQSIIHRDLKPSNVLINFKGRKGEALDVKMSGFTLSREGFDSDASDNTVHVGTKLFMAPEVLMRSSHYTKKADVYSFAMVCHRVLTGERQLEFQAMRSEEFLNSILEGKRPTLLDTCPGDIVKLVSRCWRTKAEERPDFAEICEALALFRACMVTQKSTREIQQLSEVLGKPKVVTDLNKLVQEGEL